MDSGTAQGAPLVPQSNAWGTPDRRFIPPKAYIGIGFLAEPAVRSEVSVAKPRASKASLADALFRIGALRFGKFSLSSGRASSYYLDLRVIPSHPDVYAMTVEVYRQLASGIDHRGFDAIGGVATAGVAIASPLAFLLKKPMVYVRREEKGHGLGRRVEGAVNPGWRVLVVDDLVTSGESVASAAEALRKEGCRVTDAIVLVDRLEGGEENLRAIGVKLSSFTQVRELIDNLFRAKKVTKRDYDAVMHQIGSRGQ